MDWRAALDHKLLEHILRSDAHVKSAAAQTNSEAGAEHRVVVDVRDVLWEHHDVIYMVFSMLSWHILCTSTTTRCSAPSTGIFLLRIPHYRR